MKIISDTGPIIGLAKINKLCLLQNIADEVLIPLMVFKELFGKIGPESSEIDNALNDFIKTVNLQYTEDNLKKIISELDEGEKQAINLAYSYHDNSVLLLMDDRAGREAAKKLGLPVTGLVGLLILLKEKKLIQDVGSLIEELRQNNYWLSDDIIRIAKTLAGE